MKKIIWILGLLVLVIGCNSNMETLEPHESPFEKGLKQDWIEFSVTSEIRNDDITDYYIKQTETRKYYCDDVAEDYWRYPSYDKAYNYAYEYCNSTFPEKFEREEIPYNESDWNNNITFFSSNLSIYDRSFMESSVQTVRMFGMDTNLELIGMNCTQVRCDCMDWGCMTMCLSCKDLNTEKPPKTD